MITIVCAKCDEKVGETSQPIELVEMLQPHLRDHEVEETQVAGVMYSRNGYGDYQFHTPDGNKVATGKVEPKEARFDLDPDNPVRGRMARS